MISEIEANCEKLKSLPNKLINNVTGIVLQHDAALARYCEISNQVREIKVGDYRECPEQCHACRYRIPAYQGGIKFKIFQRAMHLRGFSELGEIVGG